MGTDKASIVLGGRTLLAATVALLEPLTVSVHVAVRPEQAEEALRRGFPLLLDAGPAGGPAAGLLAARHHDPDAAWLVLACDMPGMEPRTLEALVAARDPARGGTAWRSPGDGLPEPLCAIWEPVTLARLAAAAEGAGTAPVSPRAILAGADPLLLNLARPAALSSINTPADLHSYLKDAHGHES